MKNCTPLCICRRATVSGWCASTANSFKSYHEWLAICFLFRVPTNHVATKLIIVCAWLAILYAQAHHREWMVRIYRDLLKSYHESILGVCEQVHHAPCAIYSFVIYYSLTSSNYSDLIYSFTTRASPTSASRYTTHAVHRIPLALR